MKNSGKAYDLLKIAIEGIGKYSYNGKFPLEYLEYFEEEEKIGIVKEFEEKEDYIINEKIKSLTKISNYKISFIDDINEILIRAIYINYGYKNYYSYYRELVGEFILKLQDNDEYKINKWTLVKERKPAISPLIRKAKDKENKLTLSMVVRNEENRFLKEVLSSAKEYIDNAIFIDDASTDNTIKIIEDTLKDIPYKIIKNEKSKFSNEVELRSQQWNETIYTKPDMTTNLRLKHYGWSREEDRIEKYNRYMELDPNGEFGNLEQYKSILDENPNLIKWI